MNINLSQAEILNLIFKLCTLDIETSIILNSLLWVCCKSQKM
jgi:hypothetical protein